MQAETFSNTSPIGAVRLVDETPPHKAAHCSPPRSSGYNKTKKTDCVSRVAKYEPDDHYVMAKHVDFPDLLALANEVNDVAKQISQSTGEPWKSQQILCQNSLTVVETLQVTFAFHEQLLANPELGRTMVPRGEYPIVDAVLDDSYKVLRQELKDLVQFKMNLSAKGKLVITPSPAQVAPCELQHYCKTAPIRKRKRTTTTKRRAKTAERAMTTKRTTRRKGSPMSTALGSTDLVDMNKMTPTRLFRDDDEPELCREKALPVMPSVSFEPGTDLSYLHHDSKIGKDSIGLSIFDDTAITMDDQDIELLTEFSNAWLAEDPEAILDDVTIDDLVADFFGGPSLLADDSEEDVSTQRLLSPVRKASFDIGDLENGDMETWVTSCLSCD